MKLVIFFSLLALFNNVQCKGVRATESMGQEIIEIGAPVKELPPEIEEEPSAEVDDDYKQLTTVKTMVNTTSFTTTKKDTKKVNTHPHHKSKEESSEESKVEQELNEAYRDLDYKDNAELKRLNFSSEVVAKPISRAKGSFKFQPDVMNAQEVEKFRTSVDEISCEASTQKLSNIDDNNLPGKAIRSTINTVLCAISLAVVYY